MFINTYTHKKCGTIVYKQTVIGFRSNICYYYIFVGSRIYCLLEWPIFTLSPPSLSQDGSFFQVWLVSSRQGEGRLTRIFIFILLFYFIVVYVLFLLYCCLVVLRSSFFTVKPLLSGLEKGTLLSLCNFSVAVRDSTLQKEWLFGVSFRVGDSITNTGKWNRTFQIPIIKEKKSGSKIF